MNNWDSLFLYPFLTILFMLGYIINLVKKGIKSFYQWVFIVQHFCFWLALSCSLTLNYNFIIFDFAKNINSIAILLAVSTSLYAAIFFIPASWITGLFRSRKLWFWISYGLMFLGILLVFILPQNWSAMIFCTIVFGFGVSTNSLWYLSFNEIYLYRTNPFATVTLNLPIVIIANMVGANVLMFVKNFNKGELTSHYIIFGIITIVLIFSFVFCFFMPEIKTNIGAFAPKILKHFSLFSWWKIIVILSLLFFIAILRELSQGDFLNIILAQETWVRYHNKIMVEYYLHLVQEIWWFAQIIGAMFIYFFIRKIGIKNSLILALIIWSLYFVFVAIISIPEVLLICQLLNGFAMISLFGILFSMTMMWNYRIQNRPVTGCFSALNALVTFLAQFLIRVFAHYQVGIFSNLNLDWNLPFVKNDLFLDSLKQVILYLYLGCAISCLILIAVVFFSAKFISGEYYNPNQVESKITELVGMVVDQQLDQKNVLKKYLQNKKEVT
ncbi:hypothetical protein [Spiroplasma melliferum]|uniref:hypothetical protein n=1 Tax=Spiroplasma melliferum TaxID=2134 RepID=UPI000C77DF3D|nr:hypothetical protein [Spiroplasma melliferum]